MPAHTRINTQQACARLVGVPCRLRYLGMPKKKVKTQGVCTVKTQINVYHLKTKECAWSKALYGLKLYMGYSSVDSNDRGGSKALISCFAHLMSNLFICLYSAFLFKKNGMKRNTAYRAGRFEEAAKLRDEIAALRRAPPTVCSSPHSAASSAAAAHGGGGFSGVQGRGSGVTQG
jgi:hypothetical protein